MNSPEIKNSSKKKKITAKKLRNEFSGKDFDVLWITFYKLFEVLIS